MEQELLEEQMPHREDSERGLLERVKYLRRAGIQGYPTREQVRQHLGRIVDLRGRDHDLRSSSRV